MIFMAELTADDLKYLSEFQKVTGIYPSDFAQCDSSFVFLVENRGELYKCIGKNKMTIRKLSQVFRKPVFVFITSADLEAQIRNIFYNLSNLDIKVQEKGSDKQVTLVVLESERGYAVGKEGIKIKGVKALLDRRFDVKEFYLRTTKQFRDNEEM